MPRFVPLSAGESPLTRPASRGPSSNEHGGMAKRLGIGTMPRVHRAHSGNEAASADVDEGCGRPGLQLDHSRITAGSRLGFCCSGLAYRTSCVSITGCSLSHLAMSYGLASRTVCSSRGRDQYPFRGRRWCCYEVASSGSARDREAAARVIMCGLGVNGRSAS
jgi:hypothetical protein